MPRYKHPPKLSDEQESVIVGMGKDPDSLVVQRTTPMLMLHNKQLDLFDLKLIDAYLGRINSHNPGEREIRLRKGELEDLFGVSRIRSDVLSAHLDRLMQPVTLDIQDEGGHGWLKFHLFSKAKAYKSDSDGLWTITMKCSEEAMQFVFYPEEIGYLRYFLREVSKLQSKHSYKLFILLESRRFSGLEMTFDLEELKKMLGCDQKATYGEFKDFNKFVLRKAQQELAEKTQCRFTYEPLKNDKHGNTFRHVASIRFTLEPLPEPIASGQGVIALPAGDIAADLMPYTPAESEIEGLDVEQLQALRKIAAPIAVVDDDLPVDDIIRRHVDMAKAYKARNLFAYVRASLTREADDAVKKARETAAKREADAQRAREDMERAERILKRLEEFEV